MFETPLIFEGGVQIKIDGVSIDATCGPVRTEPEIDFGDSLVKRRKISGSSAELPTANGVVVDIDGEEWVVEAAVISGESAIVTFVRYLS